MSPWPGSPGAAAGVLLCRLVITEAIHRHGLKIPASS
jgi:hypothetical protein